ncbi:hypothetical protein ANOM_000525 [Aspergillus nomiae NRRL 13137]|uniref:RNase III domain-containing protein n=1 Tax=Aspergillus nomiae NRRL (strain ATCC 15546 / NRRL 13137 / CBS 260.88 / M93) TaxID=1509407 RepID=A0A0L1JH86_ASPN3|nr:uncharacterized protein ANOM_000525 [Aspergillus nomiae NRRL 13137]KNG91129.1 hypothetical protein ANOM_000525 [Aspergillus nomiae NRRL 13137]
MASLDQVQSVESIILHSFTNKDYPRQALTAAGVENYNHEGNRQLAQVGAAWVDTVLNIVFMRMGINKEHKAKLKLELTKRDHLVLAAKRSGISKYITYSCRSGFESTAVLRNTINAIIAAVLLDTNGSISVTLFVLSRIFMTPDIQYLETGSETIVEAVSAVTNAALTAGIHFSGVLTPPAIESLPINLPSQTVADLEQRHMLISPVHTSLYAPVPPLFGCSDPLGTIQNDPGISINISTSGVTSEPNILPNFHQQPQYHDHVFQINPLPDGSIVEEFPSVSIDPSSVPDHATFPVPSVIPSEAPRSSTTTPKRPSETERNDKQKIKRVKGTQFFHLDPELKEFLANEKTKCEQQCLPLPEATYFTPEIQEHLMNPKKKLCRMIQRARKDDNFRSCCLRDIIPSQRLHLIERLEQEAGIIQIMRWYHILEMFRDCGGHETVSSAGYVHYTADTLPKARKTMGNPRNMDEHKVTQALMAEIFPDLKPDTEYYGSQLKRFNRLRRVGKRLHILTDTFGEGILGLILDNTLDGRLDPCVSDVMFWKPTEKEFRLFIQLLDKSQGDLLRKFSEPVWAILEPVLCCRLAEMGIFQIEQMCPEDILRYPKGAPGLLACIR